MIASDDVTQFWLLARKAIRLGLVTEREVEIIRRAQTRKEPYWGRHLYNLRAIVKERLMEVIK